MEKKQYVVIGEAPESDSEEEVNVLATESAQKKRLSDAKNPQGIVIAGEAPESDDEDKGSVSSISSAASISSIASFSTSMKRSTVADKPKKQQETSMKYTSLLHKKLRERNISLHRNVVEFVHHNVGMAARDLYAANQQLLKSQLQLQEVALSLHSLHSNLCQLQNKLSSTTSTTFLSRINISQPTNQ